VSGGEHRLLGALRAVLAILPLLAGSAAVAAERDDELAHRLEAIVHVHAEIPPDARTAAFLGTAREGSGIVIDDAGLVVTIGYLITEAMGADVTTAGGKVSRATVVGVDLASGLGLLRTGGGLPVRPMPIGSAQGLVEKTPVVIAGFGGIEAAQPAVVVSRRAFAGSWEYLLDDAIFTAPPHPAWSGAALLEPDGRLAGIGSLIVGDAASGLPGNMFVPIDRLRPVMSDLLAFGRPTAPPHPWLGVNLQEADGALVVARVAPEGPGDRAGIRRGDRLTALDGTPVYGLAEFYRTLWGRGAAGVTVRLSLLRQGEQRDIEVETIDRYRYLKLDTTY
jgi:S1-C subfamily serine protease